MDYHCKLCNKFIDDYHLAEIVGAIANRIGPLRRRHRLRRRRRRRWIRGRRGRRRTMRLNGATNGVRSPTMDTLCNKFIDDYHLVEAAAGRCA